MAVNFYLYFSLTKDHKQHVIASTQAIMKTTEAIYFVKVVLCTTEIKWYVKI